MRQTMRFSILALAALALPMAAFAGVAGTSQGAVYERVFDSNTNPGTITTLFAFEGERPLAGTSYFVAAFCDRSDANGNFTGKHTVIYKNGVLFGVNSGNEVSLPNNKQKIKNGQQQRFAVWEGPALDALAGEPIVGEMNIQIKKRVATGNFMTCRVDLVEIDSRLLAASTKEERLELAHEAIRQLIARDRPTP